MDVFTMETDPRQFQRFLGRRVYERPPARVEPPPPTPPPSPIAKALAGYPADVVREVCATAARLGISETDAVRSGWVRTATSMIMRNRRQTGGARW